MPEKVLRRGSRVSYASFPNLHLLLFVDPCVVECLWDDLLLSELEEDGPQPAVIHPVVLKGPHTLKPEL